MTVPAMLHSANTTVSAPAITAFRGSITHPTQSLCTLRGRRYLRLTQHSLPGGVLGLTWTGLSPADRASFLGAFPQIGPQQAARLLDRIGARLAAILAARRGIGDVVIGALD